MQLPSHMRHCMSSESSLSAFRQLVHKRHPHLSLVQLLNLRQMTHPMTRRMEGAVQTYSWLSILTPSPQMGALDQMSMMLQLSRESQWGHQTRLRLMIPLQQVSFSCFLQPLHRIFNLSLMGESVTWINLLGFTSQMLSTGLPYDMESVVKRYCGGQCSSDCPSGLVIRMQSMVFLTNATLSMRVQYCSGLGLAGRLSLLPFRMMLQCSRVNCSMVECRRSPSDEKRAVLLLFMKFLVLTERLDQFSRMLPRPQTDSFLSSFWALVLVSHRSVSGSSCLGFLGSGSFLGGLSISRQQAPISPSQYQFKPPLQPSLSQSQQRSPKNTRFGQQWHQWREGVGTMDFLLSLGAGSVNTGMIGGDGA